LGGYCQTLKPPFPRSSEISATETLLAYSAASKWTTHCSPLCKPVYELSNFSLRSWKTLDPRISACMNGTTFIWTYDLRHRNKAGNSRDGSPTPQISTWLRISAIWIISGHDIARHLAGTQGGVNYGQSDLKSRNKQDLTWSCWCHSSIMLVKTLHHQHTALGFRKLALN
jgi:hypothetical protein